MRAIDLAYEAWHPLIDTSRARSTRTYRIDRASGSPDWSDAMQIVDAQIHLWGTGLPSNLSHRQVTHFTPEEAVPLMDEGGVDAAVIHPPNWDPGSTELAFAAVRTYPGRFAIMGSVPLDQPGSRTRIAGWRQQPGMLGLRYTFLHDPARQRLADGTMDWLWAEAEN